LDLLEYFISQPVKNVDEAVKLFQEDNLFFKPGQFFNKLINNLILTILIYIET